MSSYLVTGASRGIGLGFVLEDNVVFALIRSKETALKAPPTTLGNEIPNLHVFEADIMDAKALKVAAEIAAQVTGGKLDVLINNAAATYSENDWRRILDFSDGEGQLPIW
ncbi:hypothetical protein M422DRAFT_265825 [Sphaerobolus stellatus SS14]|uniref:3-oxoacyl-[acyl-carrier-protein] reductase n=1 Tax=Sphaerobolus stellatus (strain SS14) TaxID=990650 RepID=A0A0C9USV3_SPHS4|nr:hypothetical protein M422DRAFT_265825 [Sphaerobolus stellatus SS14]